MSFKRLKNIVKTLSRPERMGGNITEVCQQQQATLAVRSKQQQRLH